MPLGNDDDTIAKVGNVDIDILALMAFLIGVLSEVGLDKEGTVRNQEARVGLLHITLYLRFSDVFLDLGEVTIGFENLSEKHFEGTSFALLFGANCFRLESAKHNYSL